MTAEAVNPFDASPVQVLPPDTTPTAIRDALIDEERVEFERAYRQALAEAAETPGPDQGPGRAAQLPPHRVADPTAWP